MKARKNNAEGYNKPFPANLRKLLDNEKGISPLGRVVTQTELAQAFHDSGIPVTRQTISLYANGETKPDIDKFKFIANYFKVSCDYLLGEADVTQRENIDISAKTGLKDKAINTLTKINETILLEEDISIKENAKLKLLMINRLLYGYQGFFGSLIIYLYQSIRNKIAAAKILLLEKIEKSDVEDYKDLTASLIKDLKEEAIYKDCFVKKGLDIDSLLIANDKIKKFDEWSLLESVRSQILEIVDELFLDSETDEILGKYKKILDVTGEFINHVKQNEER